MGALGRAIHTVPCHDSRQAFVAAGPCAGAAAIFDAKAVYLAFKGNAQTSYEKLDMQMSYVEITRERALRAATFADYLYVEGARRPIDDIALYAIQHTEENTGRQMKGHASRSEKSSGQHI